MGPSLTLHGSTWGPIRTPFGSKGARVRPLMDPHRSNKEPRRFLNGSGREPINNPGWIREGTTVVPIWARLDPSSGPSMGPRMNLLLSLVRVPIVQCGYFYGLVGFCPWVTCVLSLRGASTGGEKRKRKNNASNARLQDSQLSGPPAVI